MYFLRRRHGRKSDPNREQRRDRPPVAAPAPASAMQAYAEPGDIASARPVVITKTRRPRTALEEADDCKPAGTFRAGTLHIARATESAAAIPGER